MPGASAATSTGVRDFAVFNVRFADASRQVMNDVLHAVARAV
jgi:hypothetical protein